MPVLQPGVTCWRIERARRLALIVDAAAYFKAVKAALLEARHTIMLIGWDFDTRITLEQGDDASGVPNRLGKLIAWIADRNPELQIYILRWDLGMIKTLGRGTTVFRLVNLFSRDRIHFKLDGVHPIGAAHHQKIVVIDDALAFCGGIDMTADRWDTREHLDDDPRRQRPTTHRRYGPWHDATAAVDADVARALGDHARERWRLATGETLSPPPTGHELWPEGLDAHLTDVDVAIARTTPAHRDRREVREIEALYLAGIRTAQRFAYFESQYFASRTIAETIAERLQEPNGPEFVLVNPESAEGWLEEEAMGSARARLVQALRQADRHGRFRIYSPVTAEENPIYVHAKIMIVDDRLLKIGSSNLNNRSLGYDTECDVAVEAGAADEALPAAIAAFRCDLLAEHLGVAADAVASGYARTQSVIATIEALRRPGRTLQPTTLPPITEAEAFLADNELLDPERPKSLWDMLSGAPLFRRPALLRPSRSG
jgi:phospholipase D1/2